MSFSHLNCVLDVCREKNSIEDALKMKITDLRRTFDEENESIKRKSREEVDAFQQEMNKLQIKHEKQITELTHQLDRFQTNGKLNSFEKVFESVI